jgi:hypothetical protein
MMGVRFARLFKKTTGQMRNSCRTVEIKRCEGLSYSGTSGFGLLGGYEVCMNLLSSLERSLLKFES